jgi:predicted transcriptional regulator
MVDQVVSPPNGQARPSGHQAALFKRCRQVLGLSVTGMAEVLGVGERTVRRWEYGSLDITTKAWLEVRARLLANNYRRLAARIRTEKPWHL